jgi:hypothetical protein
MLPNAWLFLFVFFMEYFSYIISVVLSISTFLALLIAYGDFIYLFFVVIEFELRVSNLVGKHSEHSRHSACV